MLGEEVEVQTYSGQTYAERPVAFRWYGKEYQVEEVEKSWREPQEIHFQVKTQDNYFHLWYNELQSKWFLVRRRSGSDA